MDAQQVLAALETGTPLLTATQRLAREWRRRFDAAQRRQGQAVWPSADVLPLEAWVRRAAEEALDAGALGLAPAAPAAVPAAGAGSPPAGGQRPAGAAPIVLSESQARLLWERIVAESPLARDLLRGAATAERAHAAWTLLARWRLPVPALPAAAAAAPLEQRAFAGWAAAYEALLAERGWSDPARLPERVTEALRAGAVAAPPRVLLAGFDELPPQTEALLEALRGAGCDVQTVDPPRRGAAAVRCEAPAAEAEAWRAARWARYWLEHEPAARIGLVVPELGTRRAQLVRALEDVLQPGALLPAQGESARPFNVSQGIALAEYPLVAAALRLLGLIPGKAPLETWSAVLRSAFLAGAEQEAAARARLDVQVRRWGAAELSAAALQAAAEGTRDGATPPADAPADGTSDAASSAAGAPRAPLLAAALRRWRSRFDALPVRQAPSAWALACAALLAALGWPGERGLDSAEFQTLEKWHGLLEELARLDLVAPVVTRAEALATLRRLAAETQFQPEGSEAPVQVLGTLEAGGLAFDHLWVLGLHEEVWPAPPRPSPFLPAEQQRRLGMPRGSMAQSLESARQTTARLLQAAPDVVLSHPRADGDRPLRPSPLLRGLPEATAEALPGWSGSTLAETLAAAGAGALERVADAHAPPIAAGTPLVGGTSLFQDQAACPFRAFARHRLHARAPETPEPGLDARTRGSLVHAAMEHAWRQIGDHAALLALGEPALAALLAQAAATAMEGEAARQRWIGPRLRALERNRLRALLHDWLATERARAPFTVEHVEQRQPLEIGGITVTGRVDRIDRLPDGRRVLIDYKTGRANANAWWGERPDEPQLPLYAASAGAPLAAVAFARVRLREMDFRGVADDAALVPGAARFDRVRLPAGEAPFDSFPAVVERWRATLEALAGRFLQGDARVDPKRADTCQFCELPGLCRVAERRPAYAAEDEPAGDSADEAEARDGVAPEARDGDA